MKQRCNNPNNHKYPRYGGREISVCDEWSQSFMSFDKWARSNGYQKGLTIDRIDVDGNYEPNNCRWVSQKVQQNNRGNNYTVTYQGVTKTTAQWAEVSPLTASGIRSRIERGYAIKEAIFGTDPRPVYITMNGETHNMTEWAKITGQSYHLISSRVERGWDPVKAVLTPARKGNYRRGNSTVSSKAD